MSTLPPKAASGKIILEQVVHSPQQTAELAVQFASRLQPGDVVLLFGDLGSGKTFFVKKICQALQTESEATSPSFTILNVYTTDRGFPIYHFDFYRIKNPAELENIGLEDFIYDEGVVFIEWPEIALTYLPANRYEIYFDFIDDQPEGRKITIYFQEK